MQFLIVLFIVLSFPALEIVTLFRLADAVGGGWVLVWLFGAGLLGVHLIRAEKRRVGLRLQQLLSAGRSPLAGLFASGRTLLAGALFLFPGVISDGIALFLWLTAPRPRAGLPQPQRPRRIEVIEGEFRRERDDHTH